MLELWITGTVHVTKEKYGLRGEREGQLKLKRVYRIAPYNAIATVHVGVGLHWLGEELQDVVALLASVQVVIVFLPKMLQDDGCLKERWVDEVVFVNVDINLQFEEIRLAIEKLVGKHAFRP